MAAWLPSLIETGNGDCPITDSDRADIAAEPRIFASDVAVAPTGSVDMEGVHERVARGNSILEAHFWDRDLEIVRARLQGDMTREKYDALVARHLISVERIRQTQRAALGVIRAQLMDHGIAGMAAVSCTS